MYQLNRKSENPITIMKLQHWAWQDHWLPTTARKCKRIVAHPRTHIHEDASPGAVKCPKPIIRESQKPKFYYLFIVVILNCIMYLKLHQWSVATKGIFFNYALLWNDLTIPNLYIKWNYYLLCQIKTDLFQLAAQSLLCGLNFIHHHAISIDCPFDS